MEIERQVRRLGLLVARAGTLSDSTREGGRTGTNGRGTRSQGRPGLVRLTYRQSDSTVRSTVRYDSARPGPGRRSEERDDKDEIVWLFWKCDSVKIYRNGKDSERNLLEG